MSIHYPVVAAICDPAQEECTNWEVVYDDGSFINTVIIGTIALFLATLPLFMRFTVAKDEMLLSNKVNKFALNSWWTSHLSIWGTITLFWAISYLDIEIVNILYMVVWKLIGIWAGLLTLAFGVGLFLWTGAYETSTAYKYAAVMAFAEVPLLVLVFFLYDDAYNYYVPKATYYNTKNVKEEGAEIDVEQEAITEMEEA